MEITHTTEDNSITTKLIYIVGRRLRGYKGDKTHPKVTQCLVFKNGLLEGFSEAVKCESDVDNEAFALKLVTKKAMEFVYFTDIKRGLWKEFFKIHPLKTKNGK